MSMTTAGEDVKADGVGPRRAQLRLSGLMWAVLAAGVSAGLVSRAKGLGPGHYKDYETVYFSRLGGVVLLPIGAFCVLVLAGGLGRRGASGRRRPGAVAWRLLALGALAALIAEEARLLGAEPSSGLPGGVWTSGTLRDHRYEARAQLLPMAGALLMVGLVLGLRPRGPGPSPGRRRFGPWASTVMAGLGGAAIAALACMFIPYLVLAAIEAVNNAMMRPPPTAVPPLWERLARAEPTVGLAAVACLLTGGWLARDLRSGGEGHRPRRAIALRGLGVAVMVGSAWWLVFRTLPWLQERLLDGLAHAIGPVEVAIVVAGFAGAAAGLAARSLATPEASDRAGAESAGVPFRKVVGWFGRAAATLALLAVIGLCAGAFAIKYEPLGEALPRWFVAGALDPIREVGEVARAWIGRNGWLEDLFYRPDLWFLALVLPWLAWRVPGMVAAGGVAGPSPLDEAIGSPATARRFLGYWLSLTAFCLAALPTLAFAGLVVLHHALAAMYP